MTPTNSSSAIAISTVSQTGRPARDKEAEHHEQNVAHRVDDAVAVIIERDRQLAIMIDDEVGVLDHLPGRLDGDGEHEPQAERHRHETRDEPQQPIEDEAVDDVRGRVPVEDVLGVLRALHVEMPELDVAAFADERMAHQILSAPGRRRCRRRGGASGAGELHGRAQHLCTESPCPVIPVTACPLSAAPPGTKASHDPRRGAGTAQDRRIHLPHRPARQRQDPHRQSLYRRAEA